VSSETPPTCTAAAAAAAGLSLLELKLGLATDDDCEEALKREGGGCGRESSST